MPVTRSSASTVKHQPTTHSDVIDWREKAACTSYYEQLKKKDIFFPPPGKPGSETDAAVLICSTCPVQVECLEYALDKRELTDGIFGGKTPAERKWLYKRRQEAAGIKPKTRRKRKKK